MILEMSLSDLWTCFLANSWMENSRLEDLIQDIWKDDKGLVLVRHGMNNSSRRASSLANCGSARSAGANEQPSNPDSDTKQRILNFKRGPGGGVLRKL